MLWGRLRNSFLGQRAVSSHKKRRMTLSFGFNCRSSSYWPQKLRTRLFVFHPNHEKPFHPPHCLGRKQVHASATAGSCEPPRILWRWRGAGAVPGAAAQRQGQGGVIISGALSLYHKYVIHFIFKIFIKVKCAQSKIIQEGLFYNVPGHLSAVPLVRAAVMSPVHGQHP